jgi:fucose 4-O-acetylase-like acetyltransferase
MKDPSRIVWADATRGFAIILVVFGHVLGGAMSRQWVDPDGAFHYVYGYIYLFHMPLFFMISGFFYIRAISRGPIYVLISRTESIAWPYLLWDFAIRTAILPFVSIFMSYPPIDVGWHDRLLDALTGRLSWFLWTLYVMQILLIPVMRAPMTIVFFCSLILFGVSDHWNMGTFSAVTDYLPFFLFGAIVQPYLARMKAINSLAAVSASVFGFALLGVALLLGWTGIKPIWLLCGIIGSLASICLIQRCDDRISRILSAVGMASLAIYILHPYFQRPASEIEFRLFGPSAALQLAIATICGVIGPFLVWLIAERYGLRWLFRLRLSNYLDALLRASP